MKKFVFMMLMICFLFTGCVSSTGKSMEQTASESISATEADSVIEDNQEFSPDMEDAAASAMIYPLPDTTMENLRDAILSVSLDEGDVYVDETGKLHMEITVYTYDKYDMVDISMMNMGDILVSHNGELVLTSLSSNEDGSLSLNGGLFENGLDLATDDSGIYYECGYNDTKNWYQIGEVILSVADNFVYLDSSDLEAGEQQYSSDSLLNGVIANYDFTPYNTTIRVEDGQIVELCRMYTP